MEDTPHKHKRTLAQDFLTKSLCTSMDLHLNRLSFNPDHSGPLTLRVTHKNQQQNSNQHSHQILKKKASIEPPKTLSHIRNHLLQLQKKLSSAHRVLSQCSIRDNRSTIGSNTRQFQKLVELFVCNEVSDDESTINLESHKQLAIKGKQMTSFSGHIDQYYIGHLINDILNNQNHSVDHLNRMISAMKKAVTITMPSQIEIHNKKIILKATPQQKRKTLLFQLEDTLLMIEKQKKNSNDIEIGHGGNKFYVSLRPYLFSFLKKVKQFFEIVIFTTLPLNIANEILQQLDPQNKLIDDCLGKQHCLTLKKQFICKDIRIINRNIKQICIIDCKPESMLLHTHNFIPLLPSNGANDRQLMKLQRFLIKQIYKANDVREIVTQKFKMNRFWQYQKWQNLVKQLYLD